MPVVQIIIDDSTNKTITGTYQFDSTNGGVFVGSSGTSFPTSPTAGEWFVRTDESRLYRRNDANDAWVAVGGDTTTFVVGPSSATDNAIARFDGTTGKLIQSSLASVDDNGYLRSVRFIMGSGPDFSAQPVVGGQSVLKSWHGLQIVGNKQSSVEDAPANVGSPNQFGVIIPSQDNDADASVAISAKTGQTGDLFRILTDALAPLIRFDVNGNIIFSGTQTVDGVDVSGHASRHVSGGADSIKLDDLATPDDNTDLNATTGRHGLLPKLGGGIVHFLRADGSWETPDEGDIDGGSASSVYLPSQEIDGGDANGV